MRVKRTWASSFLSKSCFSLYTINNFHKRGVHPLFITQVGKGYLTSSYRSFQLSAPLDFQTPPEVFEHLKATAKITFSAGVWKSRVLDWNLRFPWFISSHFAGSILIPSFFPNRQMHNFSNFWRLNLWLLLYVALYLCALHTHNLGGKWENTPPYIQPWNNP